MDQIPTDKPTFITSVKTWIKNGIILPEQGKRLFQYYHITETAENKKSKINPLGILVLIGCVLLGLGVLLFVASNWSKLTDFAKLILLIFFSLASFSLAYFFTFYTERKILGQGLFLVSSLIYGAGIILVAQTYNTGNTEFHWLLLIWALSIFPIAHFFESIPVYILSSIILLIWNFFFTPQMHVANYFYPLIIYALFIPLIKMDKEWCIIPAGIAALSGSIYALFLEQHWVILVWALGALIYYFIKKKEYFLIAANALFILWMISFDIAYPKIINGFYLIPLLLFFILSFSKKTLANLAISLFGTVLWIQLSTNILATVYFLETSKQISETAREVAINHASLTIMPFSSIIGLLIAIGLCIYVLSNYLFPNIQEMILFKISGLAIVIPTVFIVTFKSAFSEYGAQTNIVYTFATILFTSITFILFILLLLYQSKRISKREAGLLFITILLTGLFSFLPTIAMKVIFFNILFILLSIGCIIEGVEQKIPALFSLGTFLCALFIVVRYFDIFWSLFDRSLFFIIGGILIIGGGILLEKKRRGIVGEIS